MRIRQENHWPATRLRQIICGSFGYSLNRRCLENQDEASRLEQFIADDELFFIVSPEAIECCGPAGEAKNVPSDFAMLVLATLFGVPHLARRVPLF